MKTYTRHRAAALSSSLLRSLAATAMALAVLLLFLPALHAQTTANIYGTVYDKSGGSLPGANVTLVSESTSQARQSVTNKDGYFAFPAILPGSYTVKIEAKGYKVLQQQAITVNASDQRNLTDLVMGVGQNQETVTVLENTQMIPVDSGQRAAVLDTKDIQQLALTSRNLTELLKVLPGVTSAPAGLNAGASFSALTVSNAQSAVGNGLNANGAPNRGGTSQLSDGVDIDDPGCDCNSIALLNPDFTQEVSVQTSNFGADAPRGPVVINTISKSGGDKFHGQAYLYARNDVLNANDYVDKANKKPRGTGHYYYPGGNVGGPIPFTHEKLRFWFGYERFLQDTGSLNHLQAHVPTADMRAGNFTNTPANVAYCGGPLTSTSTTGCNNLAGTILPDGTPVVGSTIPSKFLDPGAAALSSFWPAPNADPNANSGNNFFLIVPGTHNGYVYRARADYNLNEKNSFYISYQYGEDKAPVQGNGAHIYWTPGNSIPYPGGGLIGGSYSRSIAGHFVHVFGPTLTNEFIASWGFGNFPVGPPNAKGAYRSTLGYPASYGTVFNTGSPLIPSYNSPGDFTIPDFSQQDIFETGGHYLVRKEMPAFADNLTKVFGTHLLKFGAYTENVSNLQGSFTSTNGNFGNFGFGGSLSPNAITGQKIGSPNNPTANFLMGIATGYSENNKSPNSDMAYQDFSYYGDDSWKATRQLTLQLGLRFDHIGHWYDRQKTGMAIFLPNQVASDAAAGKFNPGLSWHAINHSIPNSGMPDRFVYVSPRFGVAYDVFGTGKTVFRGGWGAYRFAEQYNNYNGALTSAQGIKGYGLPSGTSVQFSQIGLLPKPTTGPGSINGGVNALDGKSYAIPVTHSYNFTVSQQLPLNSLLELAYVGSDTSNISMGGQTISGGGFGDFTNRNKVPLGAFFKADPVTGVVAADPENVRNTGANKPSDYRPFGAAYGDNTINVNTSEGYANYHSLQAAWLKRSDRLTFNLNYTWSRTMGTGLNIDPFSVRGNYGVSSIDRPHVINTSYAYNFLSLYRGGNKLLSGATNGWTVSGITTWQAGGNLQAINNPNFGMALKYTTINGIPISTANALPGGRGTGLSQRTYYGTDAAISIQPNTNCNPGVGLASNQVVRADCFTPPAIGQLGSRNYPYLHGPSFFNSDLALYKTFHIAEKHTIQFRMNAANWINHPLPQFNGNSRLKLSYGADYTTKAFTPIISGPNTSNSDTSPFFGRFDTKSGAGTQRILELALKYQF